MTPTASNISSGLGRFLLTRHFQRQEVVDTFTPGEQVYAFLELPNPEGAEYAVNLRWARDDDELGPPITVSIGPAPHRRTWFWRRAPEQPGSYRCIVETQEGQPVAEISFRVDNI